MCCSSCARLEFGTSVRRPRLEPRARLGASRPRGAPARVSYSRAAARASSSPRSGSRWLLFLPNAPYVLTDFVHLEQSHRLYDSLLIASFAFTSLALGFASLLLVQLVVTRAAGALFGWLTAVGSLFAASLGIYLGRVQRVNSWDVVHRPGRLWKLARIRIDDPLGNPHLIGYVDPPRRLPDARVRRVFTA